MASSQDFLQFEQIREGVILLKNKAMRGILMVSSLNFSLKSEEERDATLYQFGAFLNSLDFTCQMLIQSRRLNITGYLESLKKIENGHEQELLRIQTAEYRKFVQGLLQQGAIMNKRFFVVVPLTIWEARGTKKQKNLLGLSPRATLKEEDFQKYKVQLQQRMEFIALGLIRCGLQVAPLTSAEIIELLWDLHHPKEAEIGYYPQIPPELIQ